MFGLFPPSSRVTFFKLDLPEACWMSFPTWNVTKKLLSSYLLHTYILDRPIYWYRWFRIGWETLCTIKSTWCTSLRRPTRNSGLLGGFSSPRLLFCTRPCQSNYGVMITLLNLRKWSIIQFHLLLDFSLLVAFWQTPHLEDQVDLAYKKMVLDTISYVPQSIRWILLCQHLDVLLWLHLP